MRAQPNRSLRRGSVGLSAALTMLGTLLPAQGIAGQHHHRQRVVPANARPLPGVSSEGEPPVGRAQVLAVAEEAVGSTLEAFLRRPLWSSGRILGRSAERMGVRLREVSTWVVAPVAPGGPFEDGDLGGGNGGPPTAAQLTLLPSSEASIQGLLEQIRSARCRVDLMIYGWQDDPTGREVADVLRRAAERGVRVRLLVDRGGFLIHNPAAARGEPTFLDALGRTSNVTVIEPFNPFFKFDHRKLAVVDGRVAWSGGMILTEVARRRWENLAYLAEGPIVATFQQVFEYRWREVGGAPEPPLGDPGLTGARANAVVRLVETDVNDRSLKATLYQAIDHARHHVYLENPYFSDELLTAKLGAARRRGVDVRAIVTLRGNIRSLNRYVILTANRLQRAGVRVYLAPAMTHVKAMSVDGTWSYLGTGNFDELSLRHNRELGLAVASPAVAAALDRTIFLPDMATAEELGSLMPNPRHRWLLELLKVWY